jgi:hypothetical protein
MLLRLVLSVLKSLAQATPIDGAKTVEAKNNVGNNSNANTYLILVLLDDGALQAEGSALDCCGDGVLARLVLSDAMRLGLLLDRVSSQ